MNNNLITEGKTLEEITIEYLSKRRKLKKEMDQILEARTNELEGQCEKLQEEMMKIKSSIK